MLYRTCPYCGANNDPGEACDCGGAARQKKAEQPEKQIKFDMPKPQQPNVHKHHNVEI